MVLAFPGDLSFGFPRFPAPAGTEFFLLLHNIQGSGNVFLSRGGRPRRWSRRDVGADARLRQVPRVHDGDLRGRARQEVAVSSKANRRSFKLEVSSFKLEKQMVGTSNFTLYTSHSAEGRSCKTHPIRAEHQDGQVLYGKRVVMNRTTDRARKNKANFPGEARTGADSRCQEARPLHATMRNKANFSPDSKGRARAWLACRRRDCLYKQSQTRKNNGDLPAAAIPAAGGPGLRRSRRP